ncbi:hypothetical protein HYS31_01215 [Candidatus Woesearchaeota archaeon]|nr:hypothetical protein [Candidatus Woesearchaeota archaeon]
MAENRKMGHFQYALVAVSLAIIVSLVAFMSEEGKITGFAVSDSDSFDIMESSLVEYNTLNELGSLGPGNYYVSSEGIVYWLDDNSMPAVGKVNQITEAQKNKRIYIDSEGNIGYILN